MGCGMYIMTLEPEYVQNYVLSNIKLHEKSRYCSFAIGFTLPSPFCFSKVKMIIFLSTCKFSGPLMVFKLWSKISEIHFYVLPCLPTAFNLPGNFISFRVLCLLMLHILSCRILMLFKALSAELLLSTMASFLGK